MDRRGLWIGLACALLVAPVISWARFASERGFRRPTSPVDAVQPTYAAYWRFLVDARPLVPDGSSYTIHAGAQLEHAELFMISQGLFGGVTPYPAELWGPQEGGGRNAKYILLYGSSRCPDDSNLVSAVNGGAVCMRDRL